MEQLIKLVVFVPAEAVTAVRLALAEAGAGRIGRYDHCAFVSEGTGYFRALDGARPYRGQVGQIEQVPECRIETVVRRQDLAAVLAAMRAAHPYEEIAFDLVPLMADPTASS